MRLAHSYIETAAGERDQRVDESDQSAGERAPTLATSPEEFELQMGYDGMIFATRDEFLAGADLDWMVELREVLRSLLEKDRSVLSLGSGKGEHEVPLYLEGYDITASEIVDSALDDARRLFTRFKTVHFDILNPDTSRTYDDLLITGLDYALDDGQLGELFTNARKILEPGGRVIMVHRFHDNLATRCIDRMLLPVWAASRRLRHRARGDGVDVTRRAHGYRRTRSEVRAHAERAGFRIGRVEYACFGLELARLPVPGPLRRVAESADRRLHVFNSATVFELLT